MITKRLTATVRALGSHEVEVMMSTGGVDREGDTVASEGWQLDAYRRNPVVLLGHDAKGLPVGKVTAITPTPAGLRATIEFPPAGVYDKADQVRELTKHGFLNSVSVGFRPIQSTPNRTRGGTDFHEQELLELSFVSVPANADALVVARAASRNPACPRGGACASTPQAGIDGRCPARDCPMFSGVPSKDFADALAEVGPELAREAREQIAVALAAMRTPSRIERSASLFADLTIVEPTPSLTQVAKECGMSEQEVVDATMQGLWGLKSSGEMARIIDREVKAALRNLSGRYA